MHPLAPLGAPRGVELVRLLSAAHLPPVGQHVARGHSQQARRDAHGGQPRAHAPGARGERLQQGIHGGEPLLGSGPKASQHHAADRGGNLRLAGDGPHLPLAHGAGQRVDTLPLEGPRAEEGLIERHAEAELVRERVHAPALGAAPATYRRACPPAAPSRFRGGGPSVRDLARRGASGGQARRGRRAAPARSPSPARARPAHEHVGGLEVAVHQARRVRGRQPPPASRKTRSTSRQGRGSCQPAAPAWRPPPAPWRGRRCRPQVPTS